MGIEIERKFKVKDNSYKELAEGILYRQGYLNNDFRRAVRIRIIKDKGYITIKGPSSGISRPEFEYDIPFEEAHEIINNLCEKPIIEKYRYKVIHDGLMWEVDEFIGDNEGLTIAEIELSLENQEISFPKWLGEEVTHDRRYYNSSLVKKPYKSWAKT